MTGEKSFIEIDDQYYTKSTSTREQIGHVFLNANSTSNEVIINGTKYRIVKEYDRANANA